MINRFMIRPKDYENKVEKVITLLSADRDTTSEGVNMLKELISEMEMLLSK